jgi:hypothetical protein
MAWVDSENLIEPEKCSTFKELNLFGTHYPPLVTLSIFDSLNATPIPHPPSPIPHHRQGTSPR